MLQKAEELSRIKQKTLDVAELFPVQGEWTEDDYFNLPDTNHLVELSEGRLIILDMPTDEHQKAVVELLTAMVSFVRQHGLGEVRVAPMPIRLKHDKIREPDIVFMDNAHRDRISRKYWGIPDLAVEVISRSTSKVDRKEKFAEYAQAGIMEYWLVDTAKQTVEVFTLKRGAYMLLGKWSIGEVARSETLSGFEVAVEDIVG